MLEIMSSADAARVVYRGSHGIKILSGPKIVGYSPQKRPEMLEITSLADAARVVYWVSCGNKILPGTENRVL